MLLSIVIPVYFNEGNIPVTWRALSDAMDGIAPEMKWEVVFVDDGSRDASYERLLDVQREAPETVNVIKLTRNFGQVAAILAGMHHCKGDCCVVMSADLQDPVELILTMVARWEGGRRKIVLGTRESREDGLLARATSRIFYRLMRRFAIPNMPIGGFDFFLIDRHVIDIIKSSEEHNSFLQGQVLWTGFEPDILHYSRKKREIGRSRWTLAKKLKYFIDGFVSYSEAPIRFITILGLVVSILSFAYASLIVLLKLFWEIPIEGWAPIMVTILGLGGIQMIMLGVIGEYLWRNNHETRRRPMFITETALPARPTERDAP